MALFMVRHERGVRALAFFALFVLLLFVFVPLCGAGQIYSSLLRFHVVANSDSEADQALKLRVRDMVLEETQDALSACESREEAGAYLAANAKHIETLVRDYLKKEGVGYGAVCVLTEEYHAAKTYGDVTLPQGTYLSFRIVLGAGEGQNFFCVLFPPICKNSVTKSASEVLLDYGISGGARRIVRTEEGREVRFFLAEVFTRFFDL